MTQPLDSPPMFLISAFYNGKKQIISMKFYEPTSNTIITLDDNTGHKPYLLTNLSKEELLRIHTLTSHTGFDHIEEIEKEDPLSHTIWRMCKVVAKDPLSIGSQTGQDFRTIIPEGNPEGRVWESNIKYYQSYIYDRDLKMGLPYILRDGILIPYKDETTVKRINEILKLFPNMSKEETRVMRKWVEMLECPAPSMLRCALDIEVQSSNPNHFPDANKAEFPVIAAGIRTSDGKKIMLLLVRGGIDVTDDIQELEGWEIQFYNNEKDIIKEIFKYLEYPLVFTYNGDAFDMLYLYNRAKKLGFEHTPIVFSREKVSLIYGVHIDLYKFFFNNSIKNYAFKNKYDNVGLDDVAKGLLKKGKIEITHDFSLLSYKELAEYCMRDTDLTYELTSFDDELTMKLMLVIMRIANLPIEDMSRLSVSDWIRSFMYHEHRNRGILIPWVEDIKSKGEIQTKAIIKGKKYKGAIVVDAPTGIFFNTQVIDFASLYPSILKVYNLGYDTINCEHPECQNNLVPETKHWVCTKRKSLTSLLVGALKDARVKHYKKQAKIKDQPPAMKSWYNTISEAVKVIMNAVYGVFGSESFDLYCLKENTYMYGKNSINMVSQMLPNDIISSRIGKEQKILQSFVRDYDGDLVNIKGRGLLSFGVTPEHPIWIVKRTFKNRKEKGHSSREFMYSEPEWIQADKLSIRQPTREMKQNTEYLIFPKFKIEEDYIIDLSKYNIDFRKNVGREIIQKIPLTEDVADIMGLYLAEGSPSSDTINWSFGSNEEKLALETKYKLEKIFRKKVGIIYTRTTIRIYICSKQLARFMLEKFGSSASNKRIPDFIMRSRKEITKTFILGYIKGDGHKDDEYVDMTTVSPFIPLMLQKLSSKINVFVPIHINHRGEEKIIEGRNVSQINTQYVMGIYGKQLKILGFDNNSIRNPRYYGEDENNFYIPIRKVWREHYKGKVYNFETEDHTIEVSNIITHNCPPVAEAVTAYARWAIEGTIKKSKELGLTVIYGDTDSVFLHNPNSELVTQLIDWASETMNLEIEVDKLYKFVIFSARKKNYIGVMKDGTVDLKGVAGKKKHIPTLIKKSFDKAKSLLLNVNSVDDFTKIKGDITVIVKDTYKVLKGREWENMGDLAFHIVLGKSLDSYTKITPQHVKAARDIEIAEHREVVVGDIISYVKTIKRVKTKKGFRLVNDVRAIQTATKEDINVDKYIEQLESIFAPMCEPLGIDFNSNVVGIIKMDAWLVQ